MLMTDAESSDGSPRFPKIDEVNQNLRVATGFLAPAVNDGLLILKATPQHCKGREKYDAYAAAGRTTSASSVVSFL